jgi:hypothetical protein
MREILRRSAPNGNSVALSGVTDRDVEKKLDQ